jgi:hypothetical protein
MESLAAARAEDSVVLPAGAGGGDIVLFISTQPSSSAFRTKAAEQGLHLLNIELGAPGVTLLPE